MTELESRLRENSENWETWGGGTRVFREAGYKGFRLGGTLESELPGKPSEKNRYKVVPKRKCFLLDKHSFSRPAAGSDACGWFLTCLSSFLWPLLLMQWGSQDWPSVSCQCFSSRNNESFPGHQLSRHAWGPKALYCGFHKWLKQTDPLSCWLTAPAAYVCLPGLLTPPASRSPKNSKG